MSDTAIYGAWEIRTKLFNLTSELKALGVRVNAVGDDSSDLDSVACQLSKIHAELPEVFTTAASK